MQFQAVVALAFASLAAAQNGGADAAFSSIEAYYKSLAADPNFISRISQIATADPGLINDLSSLQAATDLSGLTKTPDFVTRLPKDVQPLFVSIQSVQQSILSANGVTGAQITSAVGSLTASVGSALSSANSEATSAIGSVTSAGGSATASAGQSSRTSTGGAAQQTAVMAMGAVAGLIGGLAVIL